MTIDDFLQKQSLPYPAKVGHAEAKITQFYREIMSRGADVHVSVGGLDSITLLCFIRAIGLRHIPAAGMDEKSRQAALLQCRVERGILIELEELRREVALCDEV